MTSTLWDLRIEHPTGWQQLPSSRLKIKPYDLCTQLYRSPPYKCIAWSDDNIIAFSTVEQLLYSNSIDHIGNIQQPIYIVLPETPQSHITIITPHVDTIRILEWSALSCGLHLLSVDVRDRACVWKMKEGINDWVCVHECTMENIIAAKWVSFDNKGVDKTGFASTRPGFKTFTLPPGTPAFFCVSAFTRVTMWYFTPFESWVSISCDLSPSLGYIQGHLARADIIDTEAGTVLIAVSGPTIGNTIGIYEMKFDLYEGTLKGVLKSRLELSLPVPTIPPSVLLSPIEGTPTLIHMEFDPTADGTALIIMMASLHPHYSPPTSVWGGSGSERTINNSTENSSGDSDSMFVGNVQLERWEYKTIPLFQDRSYLLPLSTLPAVKDNQALTESAWLPAASVALDLLESADPSDPSPMHRNTTLRTPPEWVAGLNPFFGTLFKCVNRFVCVGFLGGGVEIRDIVTLAQKGVVETMKESAATPHSSTLTMFGSSPPIPVSAVFSPNGECMAILRYDASLRINLVPKAARSVLRSTEKEISKERNLADLLETCMVRGSDPWDVFVRLYHGPNDNFLHLGVCDCHLVCILAAQDLHALEEGHTRHYAPRWEPLRASLHALCTHTPNSLAYVTSSARSFIFYISDVFRSSVALSLPTVLTDPINIEMILASISGPNVNLNSIFFPPNIISSLTPLGEWVMEFITLFLYSLSLFVLEMNGSKTHAITSVIAVDGPTTIPELAPQLIAKPDPIIPIIPGTKLTPEMSLNTMATLTSNSPTISAPIISQATHTPMETDESINILSPTITSPSPSSPAELAVPLLTSESLSSPASSSTAESLHSPSPSPISSPPGTRTRIAPLATPPPSASQSHTPSPPIQPRAPLDYHFEFLSAVSSIDSPLASILFDIPTLQILQNLIALVCLAAAAPIPGRPAGDHSVREMRSKHILIGSIISKLQTLLAKDPNYTKIDYVEMLAMRYAESLTEYASGTPEELRYLIAKKMRALNLDNPYTPLVHRPTHNNTNQPIHDVLSFVPFTPADGPYKECLRCGRATRVHAHDRKLVHAQGTSAQSLAQVTWVDRWGLLCPICNGKWMWMNTPAK